MANIAQVRGFEVYNGPSVLNDMPVIGLISLNSANVKIGQMAQLWILNASEDPQSSINNKTDSAQCGNCPQRHSNGGACYVLPWRGPKQIFKAWQAGQYPALESDQYKPFLNGRGLRFGAYGDPAALPIDVLSALKSAAAWHVGYTHQIASNRVSRDITSMLMLSADTESQAKQYAAQGYRYFRVKTASMPVLENERYCPADPEKGKTCLNCRLCNGTRKNDKRKSIVIDVHGPKRKRFLNNKKEDAK